MSFYSAKPHFFKQTMNAFDGYIKLEASGQSRPANMYYLNDLPGISAEMTARLGDGEIKTKEAVFAKVKQQSYEALKIEIQAALSDRVLFNYVLAEVVQAVPILPQTIILPDDVRRGCRISVINSKHITTHLKGVWVNKRVGSGADGTVKLRIYDLTTGLQLFADIDLVLVNGLNYIEISEYIVTERGSIDFVVLLVEQASGGVMKMSASNVYSACGCQKQVYNQQVSFASGVEVIGTNAVELLDNSAGMSLDVQVYGSIDSFIAENARVLASAYWYLCGSNMMNEKLASHHLNIWTTTNLAYTEQNRNFLYDMFKNSIRKIAKTLPLTGSSLLWNSDIEQEGYFTASNV